MKKILSLLILSAMVLTVAACSRKTPGVSESTPTAAPEPADILSASATNAANAKTPPASSTDAVLSVQEAYERALACVGLPVEDLYAAVGQPIGTPTYGPSCLQMGAEDGMLTYDGFSVWTVRSDTAETVHDVYLDEG